jgi:hypothetical protein
MGFQNARVMAVPAKELLWAAAMVVSATAMGDGDRERQVPGVVRRPQWR